MHQLYIATVFAGALVFLLVSVLLILRHKSGDRSRIFLAVIVLFSFFNYIVRFIDLVKGNLPEFVVSPRLLLVAIFMLFSYILYPLEVIYPGWLNLRRTIKLYSVWIFFTCVYLLSSCVGVEFSTYDSIIEMIPHANNFEVWFRLLLSLVMFSPVLFIFNIYQKKIFHNSDSVWIKKYVIVFLINVFAYIIVLMFNDQIINTLYYYVSVGCSLYIVYLELFDRLTAKSSVLSTFKKNDFQNEVSANVDYPLMIQNNEIEVKSSILIERLDNYMKNNYAWRDPDLNLNSLASAIFSNRTSLAQVLRDNRYGNYTNYIKKLRIDDFIQLISSRQIISFQEAFYFVGFRSRSTALRSFQQITGKSPTEYFQEKKLNNGNTVNQIECNNYPT